MIAIQEPRARDRYDDAIDHLTEHPEQIYGAWDDPASHPHGCLFQFAWRSGANRCATAWTRGCLTMIRGNVLNRDKPWPHAAETEELTREIEQDERIPGNPKDIMPEILYVFRDWQRRFDRELGVET